MTEHRRLAAIVSADVAGYSRLMGRDESGTPTPDRSKASEPYLFYDCWCGRFVSDSLILQKNTPDDALTRTPPL